MPDDFICEYSSVVHEKEDSELRNKELGIEAVFDAIYNSKVFTFDATMKINHPGRYINRPVWIGAPPKGQLCIGLVTNYQILEKQELFFN